LEHHQLVYAVTPISNIGAPRKVPLPANEMLLLPVPFAVYEVAATQAAVLNSAPVVLAEPVARALGKVPAAPSLPT